jgi:hypothetical protein
MEFALLDIKAAVWIFQYIKQQANKLYALECVLNKI